MSMSVPSGRTFDDSDIELLREMHRRRFVRYDQTPFRLKSGIESHVYVFGREDLTDSPLLMRLIGHKICDLIDHNSRTHDKIPCLIGIPTAGTVLAVAGAMASVSERHPEIHCRIMREVKKSYGAHQTWVNGNPYLAYHTYWLVDNVATDGASKIEAAAKLIEDGYTSPPPCLIWIDRQQGAVQRLDDHGFDRIVVAYNLLDLAYAYDQIGLWPKETVKAVEQEIAAHQFSTPG